MSGLDERKKALVCNKCGGTSFAVHGVLPNRKRIDLGFYNQSEVSVRSFGEFNMNFGVHVSRLGCSIFDLINSISSLICDKCDNRMPWNSIAILKNSLKFDRRLYPQYSNGFSIKNGFSTKSGLER